jgi:streptogramin lyase
LIALATVACPPAEFPGHDSRVALVVPEPDLIPEGIAHDPVTGNFYVGSFRKSKIIEVRPDGVASDFILPHQHGLQGALGMRVDAERRILWVNTATAPHQQDYAPDEIAVTGIFGFDVDSGRLVHKYLREKRFELDAFNDLTVAANGALFVTGFGDSAVYRFGGGKLEEFVRLDEGRMPNGIDLEGDGSRLFIAVADTILSVEMATREVVELAAPDGESLAGVDGVYYHRDSLIAVQNEGTRDNLRSRIARLALDPDRRRVERVDVLDENHPLYDQPTTGTITGDGFYYIANSQFTRFSVDFRLDPYEELSDVFILKLPLAR